MRWFSYHVGGYVVNGAQAHYIFDLDFLQSFCLTIDDLDAPNMRFYIIFRKEGKKSGIE